MSQSDDLEFVGAQGNIIAGDIRGTGSQVVLLVHGGGQTRHSWEKTAVRLAARGVMAISIDQRGHGGSAWSPDGDYALESFSRDLVAVSQQIANGIGLRPISVGASLGGLASLLAMSIEPSAAFEALVMVDVTPRMQGAGVSRITGFMADRMADGFASLEEAADSVAEYLPHRARPQSTDGLRKNLRLHSDGRYRWHWDSRLIDGPKPLAGDVAGSVGRLEAAAATLTIPVLLVRGGRSELVTMDHAQEFLRLVPQAQFRDVSEAGHMVAGDKNDVFADAVLAFVDDLVARQDA